MADMTEKPNPDVYRTYALTNGRGKSLADVQPSTPNKRGLDLSAIKMASPDARMNPETPVN